MKLSKLFKIMDSDHSINVMEYKSHKSIFEGYVYNFPKDKEYKVKRISNSYHYDFEVYVKEVEKNETQETA